MTAERAVRVYRTTFDPDGIEDGEYGDDASTDDELTSCEPEPDDDETAVQLAAAAIENAGCGQPSSCPGFHPGIWYTDPDGSYVSSHYTGERVETSAHLEHFSDEEQRAVWELVTGKAKA